MKHFNIIISTIGVISFSCCLIFAAKVCLGYDCFMQFLTCLMVYIVLSEIELD